MKKLKTLFETSPSYMKWGDDRLAKKTGLTAKSVARFKKTEEFLNLKKSYLALC